MMTPEFRKPFSYTNENDAYKESFVQQWLYAQQQIRETDAPDLPMQSIEDIRVEPERLPGDAQTHIFYEEIPTQQVSLEGASNLEPVFDECRPPRNCYTTEQLRILENIYSKNEIVDQPTSVFLSHFLGIKRKNVRFWFQNKRKRRINKLCGIKNEPNDILTYGKTDYNYNLPAICQSVVTQENYDYDRQICQSNGPTATTYGNCMSIPYHNTHLDTTRSPSSLKNVANTSIVTQINYDQERCQSNGPTTTDYETSMSILYQNTHLDTSRSPSSLENVANPSILTQENYDQERCQRNGPTTTDYETFMSIIYQNTRLDTSRSPSSLENVANPSIFIQENYDQERCQNNGPTETTYGASMSIPYQNTHLDTSRSPTSLEIVANPSILTQENYDRERCQSNGPSTTDYETFRSTSCHNTNIDTSRSPYSCENIANPSVLKQENYDRQRCSNNAPTITNYGAPLLIPYQYSDLDTSEISSNIKIETDHATYISKEGQVSDKSTQTYDDICEVYEERDCNDLNLRVPHNTEFFGAISNDESSNSIQSNDDIEGHGKQIQHQRPVIRLIERNSHGDNLNFQLRKARERKRNVDRLIEEVLKLDTYLAQQQESTVLKLDAYLAQEQESTLSDNRNAPIKDYSFNLSFKDQCNDNTLGSSVTNVFGTEWNVVN